jgi:hypothetical protein
MSTLLANLRTYLLDDEDVRHVVAERCYAGRVPEGVKGAVIVLQLITRQHHYHLGNEADVVEPTVQIDCYEATSALAEELAEHVRNRLSGCRGATAGDMTLQTAIIISDSSSTEEPRDKSDRWIYRVSVDYQIFHSQSVPTHA